MRRAVTTAEVRSDLGALGAAEAPLPRAAFVADLEARLTAMMEGAAAGDVLPEIEVLPLPAPARRVPTAAIGIAVVILLLTVGVAIIRPADGGHRTGIDLAGPAPGTGDRDTAGSSSSSEDGAGPPSAGTELSARADGDGPFRATSRTPQPRTGTTAATPGTATTTGPSGATGAAGAPPETASSATGAGLQPAGGTAPKPIALRGSGTPPRVELDWDVYRGDDFAAYLVLRSAAPDDPHESDTSGRTLMLLRIENREQTHHQDTGKVGSTPRYRIVAVDREGRTIARSGVFQADSALGTTRGITQLPLGTIS